MKTYHYWITLTAALVFACLVGLFHIHNPDVWWHIAWGEKMLEQRTIFPLAENFYFTPIDQAYLRQLPNTFLGDIGLALLYRATGVIGLQLLVLVCLLIAGAAVILVPLKSSLKKESSLCYVALLLFFGLCLGTCQLQMVRNSLFSLALFPVTLGLFYYHYQSGRWKLILLFPCLFFALWSLVHSSYIVGAIALLLLYTGTLVDQILGRPCSFRTSRRQLGIIFFLLFFLFCISLTYSCQARELLTGACIHTFSFLSDLLYSTSFSSAFSLLKNTLKPLWENNNIASSGDFIPTWTVMTHPAAWSSMLLSGIAFALLFWKNPPNKIGLLALLSFTTYFGLCYIRGTGYAAIAAVFVIAWILANQEQKEEVLNRLLSKLASVDEVPGADGAQRRSVHEVLDRASTGATQQFATEVEFGKKSNEKKYTLFFRKLTPAISLFTCLALLGGMLTLVTFKKSEFFFREKGRVFGFGKAAVFENAPYTFVKTYFPEAPCFTTIMTGSYASFLWKDKKVFVDGFFAPHPTSLWEDYHKATAAQDLSFLDPYGIQVAIVENNRFDWQHLFLCSPAWRPVAIGLGATVYAQQTILPDPDIPVELLFTRAELEHCTSPTAQRTLAVAYYNCILSLKFHGLEMAANALINGPEDFFEMLVNYLDRSQRGNIRQEPRGIKPTLLRP